MINFNKALLAFTLIISTNLAFAEIPVVDDSENYALLEEQTITVPSSVPSSNNEESFYNHEQALAHDNNDEVAANDSQDAYEKIKDLRQEVQELRGQIEVLTHELTKLKEQQLAFYKDLDARIQNKPAVNLSENERNKVPEPRRDPTTQHPIQASSSDGNQYVSLNLPIKESHSSSNTSPADEQISYLKAYEFVKNKKFSEALTAMQNFIAKYPNGYYSSNAQYWLGELYLAEKNYLDAISHFDAVLQKHPTSNKYSASLLKLGYALAGSGRYGEAKEKLREVMNKYPDTSTSELARNKLEEISSNI